MDVSLKTLEFEWLDSGDSKKEGGEPPSGFLTEERYSLDSAGAAILE